MQGAREERRGVRILSAMAGGRGHSTVAFSSQRDGSGAAAALQAMGGEQVILYIWGAGGVLVLSMLALSRRAARRSERATGVIGAAERKILDHPVVQAKVGHVFAGGTFRIHADATAAQGWFSASAAGKVKGRVALEAHRAKESDPWDFKELVLVLDKKALEARAATRRAAAEKAGYHLEGSGAGAAAAEGGAAAEALTGNVSNEDPDIIVFQLYPPVEQVMEKGAEKGAAEAAKMELR